MRWSKTWEVLFTSKPRSSGILKESSLKNKSGEMLKQNLKYNHAYPSRVSLGFPRFRGNFTNRFDTRVRRLRKRRPIIKYYGFFMHFEWAVLRAITQTRHKTTPIWKKTTPFYVDSAKAAVLKLSIPGVICYMSYSIIWPRKFSSCLSLKCSANFLSVLVSSVLKLNAWIEPRKIQITVIVTLNLKILFSFNCVSRREAFHLNAILSSLYQLIFFKSTIVSPITTWQAKATVILKIGKSMVHGLHFAGWHGVMQRYKMKQKYKLHTIQLVKLEPTIHSTPNQKC